MRQRNADYSLDYAGKTDGRHTHLDQSSENQNSKTKIKQAVGCMPAGDRYYTTPSLNIRNALD